MRWLSLPFGPNWDSGGATFRSDRRLGQPVHDMSSKNPLSLPPGPGYPVVWRTPYTVDTGLSSPLPFWVWKSDGGDKDG